MRTNLLASMALVMIASACTSPYARIYRLLAPKPEVGVVIESAALRITNEGGATPQPFPTEYEELAAIVALTLARDWPNDRVRFEPGPSGAAPAVRGSVVIAGSYVSTTRELLVWVTLGVKEHGGEDVIGRPWSIGNVRIESAPSLELALAQALAQLRQDVAAKTAAWVRDVKQEGARP